jgi:hypothetical protein
MWYKNNESSNLRAIVATIRQDLDDMMTGICPTVLWIASYIVRVSEGETLRPPWKGCLATYERVIMAQANKDEVLFNAENHVWQIQRKDSKGNTMVRDKELSIEPMDEGDAVKVYLLHSKDAPKKRTAAVTLIAGIMSAYYEAYLSAWQGTADPHKGVPRELIGQFNDCEGKFFERYLDKNHALHELFVTTLPTEDLKGNPLTVMGKLNRAAQFQAYLTAMRQEPTYSNTKSTVLGYFAYLGKLPVGDDGRLIPAEVMAVMVRNARIIEQADTSFKGKLGVLHRILLADSDEGEKPKDEELSTVEAMLAEMLDKVKALKSAADQRATERPKPGTVVGITDESIAKAQESARQGFKVVT